jgi:hypothetical protein
MDDPVVCRILSRLAMLEQKWSALEDRVGVLEDMTCTNANRLEEMEEWQVKVDDIIEDEY